MRIKLETIMLVLFGISVVAMVAYRLFPREKSILNEKVEWRFVNSDQKPAEPTGSLPEALIQHPLKRTARGSMRLYLRDRPRHSTDCATTMTAEKPPFVNQVNHVQPTQTEKARLIDFNWVKEVQIVARVEGEGHQTFRFNARTKSKSSECRETKQRCYVQAFFSLSGNRRTATIDRHSLHVPVWWIRRHNVDLNKFEQPALDNVDWFEITPIAKEIDSPIVVTFESITLTGHWVPPRVFYSCLLGMWLVLGSSVLFGSLRSLRAKTKRLQETVHQDCLTGLLNRHGVSDDMEVLKLFRSKPERHMSLIMLDIDHFKMLNDTKGHIYGDTVLKDLGRFIRQISSEYGLTPIRWGGEEFLIIAPNHRGESAAQLADEIRQLMKDKIDVSGSFGVYEMHHGDLLIEAIDKADKALYYSKHLGRDRVSVYDQIGQLSANASSSNGVVVTTDMSTTDTASVISF